ncbi:protein OS-9-like isoform X2 [Eriocheir sinensis]|uniref:protein OS-9-like isoform X2 n=1 Tax=Eriocheir sinensis TaxID=95602 RepID=UPI0021C903C5|nr:protein OS-9-like isoform X2 [Eriocheir sinensis]
MAGAAMYLSLCSLFTLAAAFHTALNIDEINSVHYAIDILNKPVIKDQVREDEVMTVVNRYGQEYLCFLPAVGPLHPEYKHDDDILDQLVDISVLLKPMETAPCLIKTVDWWTYEFCYSSVIKQYHLEDNKASGPIIILGKYESEYNWKNSSETKNRLQRFHSQFYVNGTKCDLTGESRRTEVRFHCEDGVGDYIQRVDEPESCRYVVTVATTRVCHHPYLRLQTARSPHIITCAPALSEDQYNKYLLFQEKKIKEEQELEKKLFQQNAEILQETRMEEGSSLLQPASTQTQQEGEDEDDNLKMNVKIFRVSPPNKHKAKHTRDTKEDLVEVETQITLEEEADTHLKPEDMKVPLGSKEGMGGTGDGESTQGGTEGEEIVKKLEDTLGNTMGGDGHSLISNLKPHKLLQLLDPTEPYISEAEELEDETENEDELEEEMDENEDYDEDEEGGTGLEEMEALWQASKSTKRDHFSKLQKRLRQLGKMFINQGVAGARDAETDKIAEFRKMVDNIKEGHIKQLEQEVNDWNDKILSKKEMQETDQALEEEEQKLGTALSSFMKALDVAEDKLSRVKKEMEVLEDYLDHQLKEMEDTVSDESKPSSQSESTPQDQAGQDSEGPMEGMPPSLHSSEEPLKETTSKHIKEETDKVEDDSQQKRLSKTKMEDESQKTKLEQTIKDKLQKLGHEKIGRKFEVKILTPNSLEDEDSTSSMLSQEEVEAFQNMIVNLLSANAEELEERENHRKLEKNYGFVWDDSRLTEEEEN